MLVALALLGVLAGAFVGQSRLSALDARALRAVPGSAFETTGFMLSAPQLALSGFRFPVETPDGRVEVVYPGDPGGAEGRRIYVSGRLAEPDPFDRDRLLRQGIALTLEADKAEPVPGRRSGLTGLLDSVRGRGEEALGRGTSPVAASLLRGFVLGEDERIPEPVRDEFKRSGLAHILAVSGQNVMLLVLLATPLLALLGVPLRLRLALLIGLVALYVPVAGGGPSIVRAGAMGIAGLIAAISSRPTSRWYALLLAAVFTLAIDPRFVGDVGWQLSFAAVLGILLLARRVTQLLVPSHRPAGPLRRALAEGAALTIAATISTAPLIAVHFETVSLTSLPANLIAAPAVAPAMWLGMGSAALGQVPGAPVEPLSWMGGVCAGFIAWVAHMLGGNSAQADVTAPGPLGLLGIYAAAAIGSALTISFWRRRVGTAIRRPGRGTAPATQPFPSGGIRRRAGRTGVAALLAASLVVSMLIGEDEATPPRAGLTIDFLDVGQGDSVLLRTRSGRSLLVDTGPPASDGPQRIADLVAGPLDALALTHDESDHAGGLAEVLRATGARRLVVGRGTVPEACRFADCPPLEPVAAGDVLRLGRLRVRVLWPPPGDVEPEPGADRNLRSLQLLIHWGRFRALLAGDAEQGFAPVDPGPVDLLKVAHHGSDDPGLERLLDRAAPKLAVISVGAGNSYGHPTPDTLERLAAHGVAIARTDLDGEVEIRVRRRGWSVG